MSQTWDRAAEDVGNILALEHVNVWIPSQQLATAFYVVGMGFTRDPYLMVSLDNMWVNLGQQQFHLITKDPQVVRGTIGIVVPDLDALTARLSQVKGLLEGTKFGYAVENGHVTVTCPWGNRFRCHAPSPEFGPMTLGLPYVEFTVRRGAAPGIASFYETVMGARAGVGERHGAPAAIVRVGPGQRLIFRETDEPLPAYDGHHIAIYISDFSTPHRFLAEHGIITEESDRYQYRFVKIVDPRTRECLFEVEHEVRSLTHPMYLRPLINRNAAQRQRTYQRGRDAFVPGMA
jgi:catechol 2,3-dioxygenase-like lactoylglutathione lyase family enzyme